jgi:integrase
MRLAEDGTRAIPRRITFTLTSIGGIKPPSTSGKRLWVYDAKQPALCLMVTSAGAMAFYAYGKFQGRPQRVRLGTFPNILPEQARDLAKDVIWKWANGVDPLKERQTARAEMKFGELFKWFMDQHAKPHKRLWKKDQERYDTHLATWAGRRLSSITRQEVQRLHLAIGKDRPGAANRVLALLSTLFNKARLLGYDAPNPVAGVVRFRENARERYLTAEELPKFFKALELEPDPAWRDFFALCLWTGARSSNVKAMRWSELNLAEGKWAIPASKAKAGDALTVHLAEPALAILRDRKGTRSVWVFPADSATGHITSPNTAWQSLCERAELEGLWIHDLRRTLGSWQAAGGASLQVIGKSLGHRSLQATAVYSRLDLDPVKLSVNAATAAMLAAGKVKPKRGKDQSGQSEKH